MRPWFRWTFNAHSPSVGRFGPFRVDSRLGGESACPPISDMSGSCQIRRDVPCVDGSGLARRIFTSQAWSVQPCVRPVCAVHMTAGHNALRGSGPGQKPAFDDAMALVGCPDRRMTGSALRAVRPPNFQVTPDDRRNLVYAVSAAGIL